MKLLRSVLDRLRAQSGQALVETAITLPLLVILLLGAAEMARVAFVSIEVTNAANAGAQYGAQNRAASMDTAGIQSTASNDASDVSSVNTTVTRSCSCADGTSSTCQPTDCSSSHLVAYVTVHTATTYQALIHCPGLPTTYALTGSAKLRVLQ